MSEGVSFLTAQELEQQVSAVSEALSLVAEASQLAKTHPLTVPSVCEYLAVTREHVDVLSFNTQLEIPLTFRTSSSDLQSLVQQKRTSLVKWLMSTRELNPASLAEFYSLPANGHILETLLDNIYESMSGKVSFVEFFRSFLESTGSLSLARSDNIDEGIAVKDVLNGSRDPRLSYLLSAFSKYYTQHDETFRQSPHADSDSWQQVVELCFHLLSLSKLMEKSTDSLGSLEDFFSAVRTFALRNFAVFAPRSLTHIYNNLKSCGHFHYPPVANEVPPFLFSRVDNTFSALFAFNDINDSLISRKVILTNNALYTFKNHSPSTLGAFLECIPLEYIRVQGSELDYFCIELIPDKDSLLPYFGDSDIDSDVKKISLLHCNCVYIKLDSKCDHDTFFALLENSVWEIKKKRRHFNNL